MPPLNYRALGLAFGAEFIADYLLGGLLFQYFAQLPASPEPSRADLEQAWRTIVATTPFLPMAFVLGNATTVGGAYLAARLARRIPYYHGLAMGVLGIVQVLVFWTGELVGYNLLGLLMTIPASLYGAHLARKHLPPEPVE